MFFSSAAFFILALGLLIKSRRKPVISGKEGLIGALGEALDDFADTGMIRIHSENWRARTDSSVRKNEKVTVTGIDGLTLLVTPLRNKENK